MRLHVLGEPAVERDGETLALPRSRRVRALLGWLAVHPGAHGRGEVAGLLWPDVPEDSARTSLRTALTELRRLLGDGVVADRDRLGLGPDVWVDLHAFERLVTAGRAAEAVELLRGELLQGLSDDWVYAERDRVRDRARGVLGRLAGEREAAGDLMGAIDLTRRQLALDPLSEGVTRELMRRLAAAGDRPAALAAYTRFRERVGRELGMVPSAETRRLREALREEPAHPLAPAPAPALPPALARRHRSPFVGRVEALHRLRAAWRHVGEGARRLVLIAGEPGIGKTRIAAELAREAHRDGGAVLYGRCQPEGRSPYQPVSDALRLYLAPLSPEVLRARLGPLAGELTRLIPEAAEPSPRPRPGAVDPAGARLRLFEAVSELLDAAAGGRRALLVLDDLHWGDPPTLLLLRHLARGAPAPLLILGTYRPTDLGRGHPLALALADLRRDRLVERVALQGLAGEEVRALVTAWIGPRDAAELGRELVEETAGNPFFVEELLRHLEESHALGRHGGRVSLEAVGVPESVRDVLGRRLRLLGEPANKLLRLASVVGREFDLDLLERASGLTSEELVDALDAALDAQLVREERGLPPRYAFSHALVRDALYGDLSAARRALLHRRVAEALEGAGGAATRLAELAHHFSLASDIERAVDYGRRFARRAMLQLAYEDAVAALARAVDLQERSGRGDGRAELLLELGEALLRAGAPEEARRRFDAAAAAARDADEPVRLAHAALGRSGLGVTIIAPDRDTVALLEEALARLGEREPALRARMLARLAIERYLDGPAVREPLSAEAVAVARSAGHPDALAAALDARHVALWAPAHAEERLVIAEELVARASAAGDRERELQGRNWRVLDLVELGELPAAREEIEAHGRLADALRLPGYRWWAPMWRVMLALNEGRLDDAARLGDEVRALAERTGDRNAALFHAIQTLYARWEREGFSEELPAYVAERLAVPGVATVYRADLCWLHAELGRTEEARRELDVLAAGGFAALPSDTNWLTTVASLARAVALLSDAARAATLYELLLPHAGRAIPVGRATVCVGPVDMYLGLLARAGARIDVAERHLHAAAEWAARCDAPLWSGWVRLHLAELLMARGAGSDRARAHALAADVQGFARARGLGRLGEHAGELLRTAGPQGG